MRRVADANTLAELNRMHGDCLELLMDNAEIMEFCTTGKGFDQGKNIGGSFFTNIQYYLISEIIAGLDANVLMVFLFLCSQHILTNEIDFTYSK